ncbi:MAG: glycogen synthase GlgA [Gallionellaceae bacterium]|nr:MAG: glycogen synthase GlgA [Gallionellaceae bacterium]
MRVLFVTSEVAPLIKTGGLADVSAALPLALRRLGDDVRVLVPGYPQVLTALESFKIEAFFTGIAGFPDARLFASTLPDGVPLWVIDCPELFQRDGGIYQDGNGNDWPDNALRFGLLSKVAAILGGQGSPLDWKPEIVHCNDWQTGLTPAYMHFSPGSAPCVMTVHNLAFQGVFPPQAISELDIPAESFQPHGVEYYGNFSFLKAGLYYANHITTVSPTYAEEIKTDALGFGFQGLLGARSSSLTGILNGINDSEWNPANDPALACGYEAGNMAGKAANKRELQMQMGLTVDPKMPLFGLVGRFTHQKGLDVVLEIAPQLVASPAQLVLLGSGDATMQSDALALARQYPGQIAAVVGFDENLSHLIEAGADIFLMPSRFEPCGLNQMYSQRYGTPPIVHATGGLVDSVVDCNAATLAQGAATGFVFNNMTAPDLLRCVQRALAVYRDKKSWPALQLNGMNRDFGWQKSAAKYREIYASLLPTG